jgi:hypothetical protein
MHVKRNKNSDESQHVETSLYLLPLDEGEVGQPYFPPVHEVEEEINLNDEEIEVPVETTLTSVLPAHEDKNMVIFIHIDRFMKGRLDSVDYHIDMFTKNGIRIWDVGCVIFYGDPIYDIEGSSQEEGVEVSYLEDWPSCMYDSYVWHHDDDMITYLFHPFEDNPTQHFQDDFRPSIGSCDVDLFCLDF